MRAIEPAALLSLSLGRDYPPSPLHCFRRGVGALALSIRVSCEIREMQPRRNPPERAADRAEYRQQARRTVAFFKNLRAPKVRCAEPRSQCARHRRRRASANWETLFWKGAIEARRACSDRASRKRALIGLNLRSMTSRSQPEPRARHRRGSRWQRELRKPTAAGSRNGATLHNGRHNNIASTCAARTDGFATEAKRAPTQQCRAGPGGRPAGAVPAVRSAPFCTRAERRAGLLLP